MLSQIIFVYSGESSLQTQRPQRILLSKLIEHRMIQHTYNTRLHMNDVFDLVQVFCVVLVGTMNRSCFPGTIYYGLIDRRLTIAVLISRTLNTTTGTHCYLLATPCSTVNDPKTQTVRPMGHEGGERLAVKLVAIRRLNSLRRSPQVLGPLQQYATWGGTEAEPVLPILQDLVALSKLNEALPINEEGKGILLSEQNPNSSDESDSDDSTQAKKDTLAQTFFQPVQPKEPTRKETPAPRAIDDALIGAIREALNPMERRLASLEQQTPRQREDQGRLPLSSELHEKKDVEERFMHRRPAIFPTRTANRRMPMTTPEADEGSEEMIEPDRIEDAYRRGFEKAARLATNQREPSHAQRSLFRLDGAKGRVAQTELDSLYEEDPEGVVIKFEEQVGRFANVMPGATSEPAAHLLDVWRRTVPARDHVFSARVGEAIIDAYRRLRAGETQHAQARLALLLGALEQSVLDNGRWERAEALVGLPPTPINMYARLEEPRPKTGKLGRLGQLADPIRSTTALAVHRDTNVD